MQRPRPSRDTMPEMGPRGPSPGAAGSRTLLLAVGLLLVVAGAAALASGALGGGRDGGAALDSAVAARAGDRAGRAAAVPTRPGADVPGPGRLPVESVEAAGDSASPPSGPAGSEAEEPAAERGKPAGAEEGAGGVASRESAEAAGRGQQEGAGAPDVETLLARAEETYSSLRTLRASFRQEIEVPLLERRREGHGVWLQKGRSRFKMDFVEPPEDVIVADGEHLWLYYPSTNPRQVIRSGLEAPETRAGTADVLARILAEARTNYTARYAGEEPVAGVPTHVVELRPVGRSPYREVTVWIGARDHLVRRFRILERNETVRTVTLTDLRPNVPIADTVFRFTPPPDADVFSG